MYTGRQPGKQAYIQPYVHALSCMHADKKSGRQAGGQACRKLNDHVSNFARVEESFRTAVHTSVGSSRSSANGR